MSISHRRAVPSALLTARRNRRLQAGIEESHAAAIRHTEIMVKKTIGAAKKYLQLKIVTPTKQRASAQAIPRTFVNVSAERPPSCHANTAANKRNKETLNPAPTNRSQYVRL